MSSGAKKIAGYVTLIVLLALAGGGGLRLREGTRPNPSALPGRSDPAEAYMASFPCASGGRGLFVLLGSTVMRLPASTEPIHVRKVVGVETKRAEYAGCRNSPLPVTGVQLTNYQSDFLSKSGLPEGAVLDLAVGWLNPSPMHLQLSAENMESGLSNRGGCRQASDQLRICGGKGDAITTYAFRAAYAPAPQKRRVIVMCGAGPSVLEDDCRVAYQLNQDVGVSYRFYRAPVPGEKPYISLEKTRELDEAISGWIQKSIIYTIGAGREPQLRSF